MAEVYDSLLTLHQWYANKAISAGTQRVERKSISKKKLAQPSSALALVPDTVRNAARRMSNEGVRSLAGSIGRPARVGKQKHHPDSRAARAQAAGIDEGTQKRLDYIQRCKPEWLLEIANGERAVFSSYSELRKKEVLANDTAKMGWSVHSLKADLIMLCERTSRIAYEALPLKSKKLLDSDLITVKRDISMSEPIIYVVASSREQFEQLIASGRSDELRELGGKVYFAVPAGVADRSDVPVMCGLVIREHDHWRCAKSGPDRAEELTTEVLLAMLHQSTKALELSVDNNFDPSF